MGRAKIMVSIPDEMLSELDQTAKEDHRSRSEFIREAVRLFLQVRKSRSAPNQDPRIRKAIAVQDTLAASDTAKHWDGTHEIRKWREDH
ncbi:MAG: ribbon-helix-helix protein, CopG family [Deltaproteobacteria bacterium]|nr:ribbon-helix-helix protein, CopG family [Deltaproteobacteria bacterium]